MTIKTKRNASLLNSSSLFVLGTASVLLASGPAQAFDANSLPTGGNVTGGAATIATSGNTLTVNQSSNRAIIDWRNFNIGANAQANFVQPGTSSIAVNRVNGSTDPSRIDGGLHANGQVWVLNPNGVFFGKTARVDAAGVVATTANINDKAFMAGSNKLQMTGGDSGQVVNEGHISVGEGGLAAFVAPSVRNSGTIRARLGKVTLAAGDTYTLDLAGDRLVEIGLGSNKAVVDQSGKIVNAGGVIEISAKAAGQVVDAVINTSGVTDASSVRTVGGKIVLGADVINVASTAAIKADGTSGGQITAVADKTGNYAGSYSAQGTTGDGGQIETSGKIAHIASSIKINTLSAKGKAGNWTLDPDDLTVIDGTGAGPIDPNASTVTNGTIQNLLATTGVILAANNSITVNAAIDTHTQTSSTTLTLHDQDGHGLTVNLKAPITLGANQQLIGEGTTVNVGATGLAQNGIDAAIAGATVNLAAATYSEALSITKALDIEGAVGGGTIIAPTALLDTHTGHKYDADVKTAVFVNGASGVTLNHLTIDGGTLGANAVVFWNNASGTISNSTLHNETTLNGGQTGQGLAVDATTASTLLVDNVNFTGFNKNAIDAVDGDGATTGGGNIALTVKRSTITGADNTGTNAQNGILVWERADGTVNLIVDNDHFSNLSYSDPNIATAAGVIVYGVHNGTVSVSNSDFTNVQEYISTADSTHEVNATVGNTFDNVSAASASLDQLFAIENHINDGTEDATTSLVRIKAGNVYATAAKNDLNDAIAVASANDTVNIQDGTYTIPAGGSNYLNITKALTLKGQSEGGTIIDASNASTYGLRVQANNVSLSNFTLKGPTSVGGYGIKVEPLENNIQPTDRVNNFHIDSVTETGSYKNGLDLNGVASGAINNVTVSGTTNGTGIAITDSANLTLTGNNTSGNVWGGLALYQNNTTYNQQVNNITVDGTNHFHEVNGVYMEDESASLNFGSVSIAGYDHAVKATVAQDDSYTWLQNGEQTAIDFALASASTLASVQGWNGSAGDNHFTVGYNTGHTQALSINTAINAATSGATINVNAGTYREQVVINKDLTLAGAGAGSTTIESPDVLSHSFDYQGVARKAVVSVEGADNVAINNLTIDGREKGTANSYFIDLGVHNASADIENVRLTGATDTVLDGGQHGVGLAVFNEDGTARTVTLNNSSIDNFQKNGAAFYGNGLTANVTDNTITGAGSTSAIAQTGIVLIGVTGNVTGNTIGGISYAPDTVWASAIYLDDAAGSTVSGNTVNGAGGLAGSTLGVYATNSAGTQITGNTFDGVEEGIYLGTNATVTGNTFKNSANGIEIDASAAGFNISGNTFTNNLVQALGSNADVTTVRDNNRFDRTVLATSGETLYGDLQTAIDSEAAGSTLNLAGTFGSGANVNKAGDTLVAGQAGAKLSVGAGQTGITISANDVTIQGLEIAGPLAGAYTGLDWTSQPNSWAIQVTSPTVSNFNITGNNIHDVRTGILIANSGNPATGAASGTITGNIIENTKGGVIVQYRDGSTITIANNHQGAIGNEWGVVYNTNLNPATIAGTPDAARQAFLLGVSAANGIDNNNLTVLDRGYAHSNRTAVTVDASATGTPDSGFGNARQPLSSIQAGIDAVVSGGTVNVLDGTYVIPSGSNYINVNKSLTLKGQSEANTIIDARNGSTYGLRITAHDGPVSLSDFTLYGVNNGYGLKAEATQGLTLANITSQGAGKSEFDLNGVIGGTLTNLTANGAAVNGGAETAGNGISLTDSQNITLTDVNTENNAWGGLALYQSNFPSGYTTQETGITVDGSSTFHEANGIYAQDQSSTNDFGSIDLSAQGLQYVAKLATNGTDGDYSFFQKTQQGAIDIASAFNGSYGSTDGTVQGYGGTSVNGDNHFTVGTDSNGTALSVNAALNASTTGGIIDVLNGTYVEDVELTAPRIVSFGNVTLNSLTSDASAAGAVLSGSVKAGSVSLNGATLLGGDLTLDTSAGNGAIKVASVDGAQNLTLKAGSGNVSLGNVGATTALGALNDANATALTGGTYNAGSLNFGAVNLTTVTTLDTSAGNGALTVASVDGAQNLTLKAGSGNVSLGNVGATTALGAVVDNSATTLTGNTYKGSSFAFGGPLTLTAALTTIDSTQSATAAGNITFGGNIFGTTDGGQSLTLVAGPGTGAKSANGDITLNNAGTSAVRLGSMTVSGDDFSALIVDLAGSFTSQLTGNQVFSADTLNAGGNVTSHAGGNISGAIVAGGDVSLTTPGTVSGNISGHDIAVNSGSVNDATLTAANDLTINSGSVSDSTLTAANVTATVTGDFNAAVRASNSATVTANSIEGTFNSPTVSLTSQTVNSQVTADILNIAAQQGVITGDFAVGNVSQGLRLNGQVSGVNGQQLVVEGFALPAGTQIGANGQLILPPGTVIGLLSPGGGTPRVIMVQSVQELGALLDQGYSAIVIDLTGHKKAVTKLASN